MNSQDRRHPPLPPWSPAPRPHRFAYNKARGAAQRPHLFGVAGFPTFKTWTLLLPRISFVGVARTIAALFHERPEPAFRAGNRLRRRLLSLGRGTRRARHGRSWRGRVWRSYG